MKALITGASSGIGAACATAFAHAKYDLVLVARRGDRLKSLARELSQKFGVQVETHEIDVRDRTRLERAEFRQSLTDLDVVVNNAGLAKGTESLQEANALDLEVMIDTNVKGLLWVTRAALPAMLARGRGHIINIGSVAGHWTYPGGAVYCATKHAVHAISESLRMDVHGTGLRVTEIAPGMVETEFSEVRLGDRAKAKQVYEGFKPLTGEDIAETVLWCASRPSHVNVSELIIFPTAQSAIRMVDRK